MAQIQTLKKNGERIYPMTHMKGVVDDNGNTMDVLLAEAEKMALRKLFVAAGAEYNDTDQIIKKTAFWGEEVDHLPKHYYLNGLGDITEEQMAYMYDFKDMLLLMSRTNAERWFQGYKDERLRTLFPIPYISRWNEFNPILKGSVVFIDNKIEVLKFFKSDSYGTTAYTKISGNMDEMFNRCYNIRVIDTLNLSSVNKTWNMFYSCSKLTSVRLYNINSNISFQWTKLLDKESIVYMVENVLKSISNAVVVTLHADVYVKCVEGGEWYEDVNAALTTANAAITGGGSINIASA